MVWLSVAIGGAVGACLRFALAMFIQPQPGRFPWATFTANVSGCLIMGVLYVLIVDRHALPVAWRAPLMVGFLSAFTTFSSFSIEALALWQTQHQLLAAGYVFASVIACLCAVWLGYSVAESVFS